MSFASRQAPPFPPPLPPPPPPPPGLPPLPPLPAAAPEQHQHQHEWAVFLAPSLPTGPYTPGEPYFYERKNGITTWIRPFDYIDPPQELGPATLVGERWREEDMERKRVMARERAKRDRPVRQHRVPGNEEWRRVETEQGRVFYYNVNTKESRWDRPKDLVVGQQQEQEGRENTADTDAKDEGVEEGTEMNADDAEWMLAQMADEMGGDMDIPGSGLEEEEQDEPPQEAVASNEQLSKDEQISMFKDMLRSASINPFGTWETEVHKFQQDDRLACIESAAERHDLFDLVCKELVAQKRKQQNEEQRLPQSKKAKGDLSGKDPFDQLLVEAVTSKTSFAKFCQQHRRDPRFLKLRSSREREKRFKKHVDSLQQSAL
ncbi:hypothetical protein GQ54DRAFT_298394 [Martensiomyces pterosporus]|nr:hypothetical protein GQ54DRAFT_298394 [Martensiomyces pterosporus]